VNRPTDNVRSIAAARAAAKRKQRPDGFGVFQPNALDGIVGACGKEKRLSHVSLRPAPDGHTWAFTPEQAREIAKLLTAHADFVEGPQEEGEA
jgi:hypothetical protein